MMEHSECKRTVENIYQEQHIQGTEHEYYNIDLTKLHELPLNVRRTPCRVMNIPCDKPITLKEIIVMYGNASIGRAIITSGTFEAEAECITLAEHNVTFSTQLLNGGKSSVKMQAEDKTQSAVGSEFSYVISINIPGCQQGIVGPIEEQLLLLISNIVNDRNYLLSSPLLLSQKTMDPMVGWKETKSYCTSKKVQVVIGCSDYLFYGKDMYNNVDESRQVFVNSNSSSNALYFLPNMDKYTQDFEEKVINITATINTIVPAMADHIKLLSYNLSEIVQHNKCFCDSLCFFSCCGKQVRTIEFVRGISETRYLYV